VGGWAASLLVIQGDDRLAPLFKFRTPLPPPPARPPPPTTTLTHTQTQTTHTRQALCLMMSSAVPIFAVANLGVALLLIIMMASSGVLINFEQLPVWVSWMVIIGGGWWMDRWMDGWMKDLGRWMDGYG
jgi:hypothetical protein